MTRVSKRFIYLFVIFNCFVVFVLFYRPVSIDDTVTSRYKEEISRFIEWDKKNTFPKNAVLFVGSSTVRLWPTAESFQGVPIINRGFGGAELSDLVYYYSQIFKPYSPAKIVIYAGENDIARGKSVKQVFGDFQDLTRKLSSDFPNVDILFISIKRSISRKKIWPEIYMVNQMVQDYALTQDRLEFIDLAVLIDEREGVSNVYTDDGIHLNSIGYGLWHGGLAPYL